MGIDFRLVSNHLHLLLAGKSCDLVWQFDRKIDVLHFAKLFAKLRLEMLRYDVDLWRRITKR